jgi:hypothetical protein
MGFTFSLAGPKGGRVGCHFDKPRRFVMKTGGWFPSCPAAFRRPARGLRGLKGLFGSLDAIMVATGEDWSDF